MIIANELFPGGLLKEHLASAFKEAIIEGRLAPGQRVIEGIWAREFGVAQASVREAINLLMSEGFLVKDAGRSARVVNYGEADVARIYEVRGAMEGLAAQLACASRADLSGLESAYDGMEAAVQCRDMKALIGCDLAFHISLGEASGNPLLLDVLRRLLAPLFAFIQMRVMTSGQGPEAWSGDLPRHKWMIQLIREGNPVLAGQYVPHSLTQFSAAAYAVWGNAGASSETTNKASDVDGLPEELLRGCK